MSRAAEIELEWADGKHLFRLAIGQLRELQEKTNAGPNELFNRLGEQTWRVDDIRETIRLGLIGGGAAPERALGLTGRYVDERPLLENVPVARAILLAALIGAPEETPPKRKGARRPKTGESGSPPSTD